MIPSSGEPLVRHGASSVIGRGDKSSRMASRASTAWTTRAGSPARAPDSTCRSSSFAAAISCAAGRPRSRPIAQELKRRAAPDRCAKIVGGRSRRGRRREPSPTRCGRILTRRVGPRLRGGIRSGPWRRIAALPEPRWPIARDRGPASLICCPQIAAARLTSGSVSRARPWCLPRDDGPARPSYSKSRLHGFRPSRSRRRCGHGRFGRVALQESQ